MLRNDFVQLIMSYDNSIGRKIIAGEERPAADFMYVRNESTLWWSLTLRCLI